eukprot:scaffold433010_cov19-Prasinocladus_malaysianus.AAC.1
MKRKTAWSIQTAKFRLQLAKSNFSLSADYYIYSVVDNRLHTNSLVKIQTTTVSVLEVRIWAALKCLAHQCCSKERHCYAVEITWWC